MTIGIRKNKQVISWRIIGLVSLPPTLTMMINPSNLDLNYTQLVNETRTLGGFIQEFWGEQLTTLSASGQTAMFYDEGGITNKNSRISESYQNFIRLVNIYKNNGKDYQQIPSNYTEQAKKVASQNPNSIKSFGAVVMTYMGKEYEGYFESFSFKEMAEKPYNFEYDFSFKIVRIIGDFIVQNGNFIREVYNG